MVNEITQKIADYAYSKTLIESIDISETGSDGPVTAIGSYAFYNCRELRCLTFDEGLSEIGSDAFMNCTRLHTLIYRGSSNATGALQKILVQVTGEVEVIFGDPDFPECRLLFPEYSETYDEIGPAHVFGKHIEGEGLRARQCFANGAIDFAAYDTIWEKARAEESEKTLCILTADRLLYPIGLSDQMRQQYEDYLKDHQMFFADYCVKARKAELMELLSEAEGREGPLLDKEVFQKAAELASQAGWAEGVAEFLTLGAACF